MIPLVSVLMPVYNAADTLPLALASLQAQTYENWECIVVDDGSTDDPASVIESVCDTRIQFHRLPSNHGRGYARQQALNLAQGRYITFLDADDWICPTKFAEQVELLTAEPEIAIVSTGMAISHQNGDLAGIRNSGIAKSKSAMTTIAMPPLAFAPSMMSASLARETSFDTSFPISEDVDFLLRALIGKQYAVLPAPLYVYRERGSATPAKVNTALNYCCRMFMKQFDRYPVSCTVEIAQVRGKQAVYRLASALGMWEQIIARRSRPPSCLERQQYQDAWKIVANVVCSQRVEQLASI